jgi:hypothetical protein
MKKIIALLSIVMLIVVFSCEETTCWECKTRTNVNTTLETVTTEIICDMSTAEIHAYEKANSSVTLNDEFVKEGGDLYYSQTITKCKKK